MATASLLRTDLAGLATIGDPEGTRTVTSLIALLVAVGIALLMVAVWLYRTTRPDPELLAPLEVMGDRKWRRADPVAQRRGLDELRPEAAVPLSPSAAPPDLDEAFEKGPLASGFDDLRGEAVIAASADANRAEEPATSAGDDDVRDIVDDVDDVDDGRSESSAALPPVLAGATPTPKSLERPDVDDLNELLDRPIDPAVLAAAEAELEADLARSRAAEAARPSQPPQLPFDD